MWLLAVSPAAGRKRERRRRERHRHVLAPGELERRTDAFEDCVVGIIDDADDAPANWADARSAVYAQCYGDPDFPRSYVEVPDNDAATFDATFGEERTFGEEATSAFNRWIAETFHADEANLRRVQPGFIGPQGEGTPFFFCEHANNLGITTPDTAGALRITVRMKKDLPNRVAASFALIKAVLDPETGNLPKPIQFKIARPPTQALLDAGSPVEAGRDSIIFTFALDAAVSGVFAKFCELAKNLFSSVLDSDLPPRQYRCRNGGHASVADYTNGASFGQTLSAAYTSVFFPDEAFARASEDDRTGFEAQFLEGGPTAAEASQQLLVTLAQFDNARRVRVASAAWALSGHPTERGWKYGRKDLTAGFTVGTPLLKKLEWLLRIAPLDGNRCAGEAFDGNTQVAKWSTMVLQGCHAVGGAPLSADQNKLLAEVALPPAIFGASPPLQMAQLGAWLCQRVGCGLPGQPYISGWVVLQAGIALGGSCENVCD
jgi:hypothetical protein